MKNHYKQGRLKGVLCVTHESQNDSLSKLLNACNFSFRVLNQTSNLFNDEMLKENCIVLLDIRPDNKIPDFFERLYNYTPIVLLLKEKQTLPECVLSGQADVIFDYELNPDRLYISLLQACKNFSLSNQIDILTQQHVLISKVTHDIIWDWDLKEDVIKFSGDGWKRVFGFENTRETMTFEEWVEYVHPDDRTFMRKYYQDVFSDETAEEFTVEYRMRGADGYVYIMERGAIIKDDWGDVIRLVGFTRNVDRIKSIEQERDRLVMFARETSNGVVMTDVDRHIQWSNNAFKIKTGVLKDGQERRTIEEILFPNDKEAIQKLRADLDTRNHLVIEVENKFGNKEDLWLQASFQKRYNNEGLPAGHFIVLSDITSQKRVEEKLRFSERKFRALVENIRDGISVVLPDNQIVELYSGSNILGYSMEELNSGIATSNVHPDYAQEVSKAFRRVVEKPFYKEQIAYKIKKKSGEYIWLDSTMYNLQEEKAVKGILINFRDITDEKNAEELLKSSEKKYRELFYNNPLAIIVWDPGDFRILEVNMAAVIQYGYETSTLTGMNLKELLHPESRKSLETIAKNSLENTLFYTTYQSRHIDKEGNIMYMEVTFHPVEYFEKKASMAIIKNISEQIELENRLEKERVLKQQEVTQAAITAQEQERLHIGLELHDNINQILATVRLYIEYALSNSAKTTSLLESAKNLLYSAVNEVRNISKSLLPPSVGEKGLVASIDDLFDSVRRLNLVEIRTNWEMDERLLTAGLKLTVFRIIQEQLNNIIKHAQAKHIFVELVIVDKKLKLLMEDDGVGFIPEDTSRGVGLRNIRSRVELHNGAVQIQSKPGNGTRLIATFSLDA